MDARAVPGIGWSSVTLSLASLGVVCVVAWGALRLLAGRGVGKASGAVRVVARCPLEPRRSVYVIEAAGRCFLVGVGDGPMTVLAELDGDKLQGAPEAGGAAVRRGAGARAGAASPKASPRRDGGCRRGRCLAAVASLAPALARAPRRRTGTTAGWPRGRWC